MTGVQTCALPISTPSRVTVAVNVSTLAAGTYNATIRISAPGAVNPALAVAVTLIVTAPAPVISAGGVASAATSRAPLSAGALGSLFGDNLGPAAGVVTRFLPGTQMLPTRVQGVRVLVRDLSGNLIAEAPLLFISSRQINFQLPVEVSDRASVQVVVENNGLLSAPETVALAAAAPGIFTLGGDRAAAQNQDFTTNGPGNPAPRGSVLIAYLTGQGPLSIRMATGQAAPLSPLVAATSAVAATIGGVAARVLFLGLTPGLVGVAQANILVPAESPMGQQPLVITIGGQASNTVFVSIR